MTLLAGTMSGCAFLDLEKDLKKLETNLLTLLPGTMNDYAFFDPEKDLKEFETSFVLAGKVHNRSPQDTPIVIVLYQQNDKRLTVSQYLITDNTNHFSFIVSEGIYYISAFEDFNENLTWDKGESFGYFGKPDAILVDAEEMVSTVNKSKRLLDIELSKKNNYPIEMPLYIASGNLAATSFVKIGVITDLDNKIFAKKNGSLGYWKPFSFIKKIGIGIYFLDAYDPTKIPVLFVHGANGTPVDWHPIVAKLDRQQYQPWFFYYPTGIRLNSIAKYLNFIVHNLHGEYRFDTLHVVAHSIGGLVSRAFIIKNVVEDQQNYIEKFISISTPWGGVNTAALGVEKAPAIIPNWHDISPDSEFLQYIFKNSLPRDVKFHLLFGVRGKCSTLINMLMNNNDGTVEIASEIDYRAQADAIGFYGFDEGHASILTSNQVIDLLLAVLEDRER